MNLNAWLGLTTVSSESAVQYSRNSIYWDLALAGFALLVFALLLFSGFSAGLQNRLELRIRWRWLVQLVYSVVFGLITLVLLFPLIYYRGFSRERLYGLSAHTFETWFADLLKLAVIGLAANALFTLVTYAVIRRFPRAWWAGASLAGIIFLFLAVLIWPVYIDPLFNQLEPLEDSPLRAAIEEMAHDNGIETDRIFLTDASKRSRKVNAYVAGLGRAQRIVLWDNLLTGFEPEEVLFVLGHEIGHYVLGHVWITLTVGSFLVIIVAALTHRLSGSLIRTFGSRWGFWKVSNIASLPLLALLTTLLCTLLLPAINSISRGFEAQADRFSLLQVRNVAAAVSAFEKLAERNLAEPYPPVIIETLFYTHPSLGRRIENAKRTE